MHRTMSILSAAACLALAADTPTNVLTQASGIARWDDPSKWSLQRVPQDGDCAIVEGNTLTVLLDASTPALDEFVLRTTRNNPSPLYRNSLVVSNWTTCVRARRVALDMSGTIKTVGQFRNGEPSNRVWIAATTLELAGGGRIEADGAGWAGANGPCWAAASARAKYQGGSYGGAHPYLGANNAIGPATYGDAAAPVEPGCGAYQYIANGTGAGGGAIRIDLSGDFVCNGVVSANGKTGSNGGGSGGGVYVTCRTISGSGTICANGRNGTEAANVAAGGGGRVAVVYDVSAQNGVDCDVRFEARGGFGLVYQAGDTRNSDTVGWRKEWIAAPGTLYFPDSRFLTGTSYRERGWKFAGVWCAPDAPTALYVPGELVLDRCMLSLPSVKSFSASGGVTLVGTGGVSRLEHGLCLPSSAAVTVGGDLVLKGARFEMRGGSLAVAGNLVETTNAVDAAYCGGALVVYAAPTNAAGQLGASVRVDGTWSLGPNSVCRPHCDDTNGAVVAFSVRNLVLDAGAAIDADMGGYRAWRGSVPGGGPGMIWGGYVGASHGGVGGTQIAGTVSYVASPYGDSKRPDAAGTGGYTSANRFGFPGGGTVIVKAARSMTLNGLVTACSNREFYHDYSTGGSGGSVYLAARDLYGTTGEISADGGLSYKGGAAATRTNEGTGGGGRIAVWCQNNHSSAVVEGSPRVHASAGVDAVARTEATYPGDGTDAGTVFWGVLAAPGMVINVQ